MFLLNTKNSGKFEFRPGLAVLGIALLFTAWMTWPQVSAAIPSGNTAPELSGKNWLNSEPLTISDLKGRVVLVEFWTYG